MDSKINELINETGLNCLPTCRKCCTTPSKNIEVSIFEMLPLSIRLWQFGEAERWLEKVNLSDENHPCILLERDISIKPDGGCRFYLYRPLLCRMFGFSSKRDKNGELSFSSCKLIKNINPAIENTVNKYIKNGKDIPVYSDFSLIVAGLNPYLTETKYPINIAFKKALEYIGYRWDMIARNMEKTV